MSYTILIRYKDKSELKYETFDSADFILNGRGALERLEDGKCFSIEEIFGFANNDSTLYINNQMVQSILITKK